MRDGTEKELGWFSLEKMKDKDIHLLSMRGFQGITYFSGIINKGIAKIKEINENDDKGNYIALVRVMSKNPTSNKFEKEDVQILFNSDQDRKSFVKVFSEVAEIKNTV